jgi:hypothetical protein
MAESSQTVDIKLPNVPMVVLERRQKAKVIVNISGTFDSFAKNGCKVVYKNIKDIFGTDSDVINNMLPLNIGICKMSHNLPISVAVDIPMGTKTLHSENGPMYQAILQPNEVVVKQKVRSFTEKLDEKLLRAACNINEQILEEQVSLLSTFPNICYVTSWLYDMIESNREGLEELTQHRITAPKQTLSKAAVQMHSIDKVIVDKMLEIIKHQLKTIPYHTVGPEMTISFEPVGTTWAKLAEEYSKNNSVAEQAYLNMPFHISGVVKFVYAVMSPKPTVVKKD